MKKAEIKELIENNEMLAYNKAILSSLFVRLSQGATSLASVNKIEDFKITATEKDALRKAVGASLGMISEAMTQIRGRINGSSDTAKLKPAISKSKRSTSSGREKLSRVRRK